MTAPSLPLANDVLLHVLRAQLEPGLKVFNKAPVDLGERLPFIVITTKLVALSVSLQRIDPRFAIRPMVTIDGYAADPRQAESVNEQGRQALVNAWINRIPAPAGMVGKVDVLMAPADDTGEEDDVLPQGVSRFRSSYAAIIRPNRRP